MLFAGVNGRRTEIRSALRPIKKGGQLPAPVLHGYLDRYLASRIHLLREVYPEIELGKVGLSEKTRNAHKAEQGRHDKENKVIIGICGSDAEEDSDRYVEEAGF